MLNWIIDIMSQYLEQFNYVQINEKNCCLRTICLQIIYIYIYNMSKKMEVPVV